MKKGGGKSQIYICMGIALGLILSCAATIILIDPFFHYHAPLKGLNYTLYNDIERHQNLGIVRHFDYDTIITGSSMTQNFKTSECNTLFDANSIKVSCSAARNAETHRLIEEAFRVGKNIDRVIVSLDYFRLIVDAEDENNELPEFMLNDIWYDDVKYVLNLDTLVGYALPTIGRSLRSEGGIDFDTYSNWDSERPRGAENVLKYCHYISPAQEAVPLTDEERELLIENINGNYVSLANEHPETVFYIFFPPYSICYWRTVVLRGELDRWLEAEKLASEMLLTCPNVRLFSLSDCFDITTELDNYSDTIHYAGWVNSLILRCMSENTHRITTDNLQGYFRSMREFYSAYDYNSLYPQED